MHTYALESEDKIKNQFCRVASNELHWENKTNKPKRSIREGVDFVILG